MVKEGYQLKNNKFKAAKQKLAALNRISVPRGPREFKPEESMKFIDVDTGRSLAFRQ